MTATDMSGMTTRQLEIKFKSLKESPSKGVGDEVLQELLAMELDQREHLETYQGNPYHGA